MPRRCPVCARAFSDAEGFCSVDGSVLDQIHDADPMIGQVLDGRYRIVSRLGEGGMSTVFAAEQAALGREVAVKMVRADRLAEPRAAERLLREARCMSTLRSPHIVAIFDVGRLDSGAVYLIMERLHGETLDALIAREHRLPWSEALVLLVALASALADAHAAGVVHRDLKPANIFLAASAGNPRFVKVLDFGIAWRRDQGERLTSTHTVAGTPSYLAPERMRGSVADPRSDVFSFGVIAYELLAGTRPWRSPPGAAVIDGDAQPPAQALARACAEAGIPGWLDDLVLRCLAWSPNLRPHDGTALLACLLARSRWPKASITPAPAPALAAATDDDLATPGSGPAERRLLARRGATVRGALTVFAASAVAAAAIGYGAGRSAQPESASHRPVGADLHAGGLGGLAIEIGTPRVLSVEVVPSSNSSLADDHDADLHDATHVESARGEPPPPAAPPRRLVTSSRALGPSAEDKARIDRFLGKP